MALIAHWPLNGDFKDISGNGYDLVQKNGSNITLSQNGKIGSCYETATTGITSYLTNDDLRVNFGYITMCGWVNVSSKSSSGVDGLFGFHSNISPFGTNHGRGLNIDVHTSSNNISFSYGDAYTVRRYNEFSSGRSLMNSWSHICATYSKDDNSLRVFQDGLLVSSHTIPIDVYIEDETFGIFKWSSNHATSTSYRPAFKCNDVRIYDEILSESEIYEIAQAKIFHLQPNQSPVTSEMVYDHLVGYSYIQILESKNRHHIKFKTIREETSSVNCIIFGPNIGTVPIDGLYKVSGYASLNGQPAVYNGGEPVFSKMVKWFSDDSGYFEFVAQCETTSTFRLMEMSQTHFGGTKLGDIFEFSDLRFEHYYDNTGTESSNRLNDLSGFGTEVKGVPGFSPMYNPNDKSFWFNENECIEFELNMPDKITLSGSFKTSEIGINDYHSIISLNSTNAEMTVNSSGHARTGLIVDSQRDVQNITNKNLLDNEWHTITITYDGSQIMRYVDGKEELRNNRTGSLNIGTMSGRIGCFYGVNGEYRSKDCEIKDLRVYATALSPEDVSNIHSEVLNINKEGVMFAKEINTLAKESTFSNGQIIDLNGFEEDLTYNTRYVTYGSNKLIPFSIKDTNLTFNFKVALQGLNMEGIDSRFYIGIACYDKNGAYIQSERQADQFRCLTTQELNPGDDVIHVDDSSQFYAINSNTQYNRINLFGGSTEFEDFTHSDNSIFYKEISPTQFTLTSTYSGPTLPIGSPIGGHPPGGYLYYGASNVLYNGEIQEYEFTLTNIMLREGTESFQPILLLNRALAEEWAELDNPHTLLLNYSIEPNDSSFRYPKIGSNLFEVGDGEINKDINELSNISQRAIINLDFQNGEVMDLTNYNYDLKDLEKPNVSSFGDIYYTSEGARFDSNLSDGSISGVTVSLPTSNSNSTIGTSLGFKTRPFSIEFYVKNTHTRDTDHSCIFKKLGSGFHIGIMCGTSGVFNNRLAYSLHDSTTYALGSSSTYDLNLDTWNHFVMTWNPTGVLEVFVNGELYSSITNPHNIVDIEPIQDGIEWYIGCEESEGHNRCYDGEIGFTRLYDFRLTPEDCMNLYEDTLSQVDVCKDEIKLTKINETL